MPRIKPPTQPEKKGFNFKKPNFGIPKIPDIKSLFFGKQPEYDSPVNSTGSGLGAASAFIPVKDIRDGIIITADNRYIKVLEVLPVNFYLKSAIEQQNIVHYFANCLKIAPYNLQIIVQTGKADIDAYCANMEELHDNEENINCREMIYENAQLVNYLAVNEAITHRFFLVFQYENTTGASSYEAILKSLDDHVNNAKGYLDYCGLEFVSHVNPDDFLRQMLNKQRSTAGNDSLSPATVDTTNKEFIIIDGVYYSYLYVAGYGYNTQNGTAWLAPFVEAGDGISFSFTVEKLRKDKILPRISKITMINRSRMRDVGDTRIDFEQLDDAISAGLYLKDEMNRNGEEFYYMHTLIEITADDEETLRKRIAQTETMCTATDIAVKRADYKHKEAYLSSLPLLSLDPDLKKMSRQNVLTSGLAGSFPFSSFELCDQKGVLMGINRHNNSAVIADFFDSSKYSNANLSIMGMSGAGKTFLLQLMTLRLRMQGTQVFIIAPLKGWEFKKACEAIGGKYIKLSPGSEDCINIMEIRRTHMGIVHLVYDTEVQKYNVIVPEQIITRVSVDSKREEYPEHVVHVMDIHSHNIMAAKFSSTDDRDEKETRLYGVIGRLDKIMPEVALRASNGGKFIELGADDVFDYEAIYPEEWFDNLDHKMAEAICRSEGSEQ